MGIVAFKSEQIASLSLTQDSVLCTLTGCVLQRITATK